jgi:hypothetical protein
MLLDSKARMGSVEFELWLDGWDGIPEVSFVYHSFSGMFKDEIKLTDALRRTMP